MKTSEPQTFVADNDGSTPAPNSADSAENSSKNLSKRRPRRSWRWLLIALLVVGGGIAAWRLLAPKTEQPAANARQPKVIRVKLASVQTATVEETSDFIARLESRRSVTLQPQIQGKVTRIFAKYGDSVAAGQPIIQVDPAQQQASVSGFTAAAQAAQSDVENARATLKSLEAERLSNISSVQFNQKQYQRYSSLAAQGAVARSTGEQYGDTIRTAQANLAAINQRIQAQKATVARAENALRQAQANIKQQQVQLQYYKIAAPFAGTVGDIPVKVGDLVNASTRLTTITQNQPLEVNVSVPIERAPQLRLGMPVEVMDGQGRSMGTSQVFFISPNATDNTQSVLIKSLFDNSKNQLRADQYARAKVIWDRSPGILIPTTAISRLGGETFVYVAQTQAQPQQGQSEQKASQPQQAQATKPRLVARQKVVKLGAIQGNNYQVLEGLKPGERLVVSGLLSLKDNAPILPE